MHTLTEVKHFYVSDYSFKAGLHSCSHSFQSPKVSKNLSLPLPSLDLAGNAHLEFIHNFACPKLLLALSILTRVMHSEVCPSSFEQMARTAMPKCPKFEWKQIEHTYTDVYDTYTKV